jgi:5-methylcytosine-specific restriction endonuclease McrA
MSKHHPSTRNMRTVKAAFREECETEQQADGKVGRPCWLCGQVITYADRGTEDSFELDHYYPASTHPEHYEDPANFRASHSSCNRERSNKPPRAGLGVLSRAWVS